MIAFAKPTKLPESIECLFLGGPLDGKLLPMREIRPIFRAPECCGRPPVLRSPWSSESFKKTFHVVDYQAWTFNAEGKDIYFYAIDGIGLLDILHRLVKAYAGQEKSLVRQGKDG